MSTPALKIHTTETGVRISVNKEFIEPELTRIVRETTEGRPYDSEVLKEKLAQLIEDAALTQFGVRCANPWPISISLSCGKEVRFNRDELPTERVMCPCGDPNHILVDVVVEDGPLG
jgi:hypothetical protein